MKFLLSNLNLDGQNSSAEKIILGREELLARKEDRKHYSVMRFLQVYFVIFTTIGNSF